MNLILLIFSTYRPRRLHQAGGCRPGRLLQAGGDGPGREPGAVTVFQHESPSRLVGVN